MFREIIMAVLSIVLGLSAPANAGVADAKNGSEQSGQNAEELAGTYNLVGQIETASMLKLKSNGSFDWYLIVGALDMSATGRWTADSDLIVLSFDRFSSNDPSQVSGAAKPFETLRLRREKDELIPERGIGGKYVRVPSLDQGIESN